MGDCQAKSGGDCELCGHMRLPVAGHRPDHRAGVERLQSIRIVQRKRRPTSNVDFITVLRDRRRPGPSTQSSLRTPHGMI